MTNLSDVLKTSSVYAYMRKVSSVRPHISLALTTVLCFIVIKVVLIGAINAPSLRLVIFSLSCVIAIALSSLKTRDLSRAPRLVFCGIVGLFSLYITLAAPSVILQDIPALQAIELSSYRWLAPALGILALWRTAWALPLLIVVLWQKAAIASVLGIVISPTDYMPVFEFGMMLTLGSLIFFIGQRHFKLWEIKPSSNEIHILDAVFLTAIAAHFSNYLYSGIQKIRVSDPWWQWGFENPTYNLTLAALENGAAPISILGEETVRTFLDYQIAFNAPQNITLLLLQLAAVIAITRIRWAAVTTLLYDVTHVVIFLATGIFFYKWIWLNLLITIALATMSKKQINRDLTIWLVSVVIFAPLVFFVALLGWIDTPSFNDEYIEAITDDGEIYRVPSNYFLSGSLTHGQQRLIRFKPGHFQTDTYGSLDWKKLTPSSFENTRNCDLKNSNTKNPNMASEMNKVAHLLRNHHNYILKHLRDDGTINYDLYPHHIFSMPWNYTEFRDLDKRRITSYRYVAESKCMAYKNRQRTAEILIRGEFDVPIQ